MRFRLRTLLILMAWSLPYGLMGWVLGFYCLAEGVFDYRPTLDQSLQVSKVAAVAGFIAGLIFNAFLTRVNSRPKVAH